MWAKRLIIYSSHHTGSALTAGAKLWPNSTTVFGKTVMDFFFFTFALCLLEPGFLQHWLSIKPVKEIDGCMVQDTTSTGVQRCKCNQGRWLHILSSSPWGSTINFLSITFLMIALLLKWSCYKRQIAVNLVWDSRLMSAFKIISVRHWLLSGPKWQEFKCKITHWALSHINIKWNSLFLQILRPSVLSHFYNC